MHCCRQGVSAVLCRALLCKHCVRVCAACVHSNKKQGPGVKRAKTAARLTVSPGELSRQTGKPPAKRQWPICEASCLASQGSTGCEASCIGSKGSTGYVVLDYVKKALAG